MRIPTNPTTHSDGARPPFRHHPTTFFSKPARLFAIQASAGAVKVAKRRACEELSAERKLDGCEHRRRISDREGLVTGCRNGGRRESE